jgi:hypothetical protein
MEIVELEATNDGTDTEYYSKAADYWAAVPTTIDGMLGGFAKISHTDIDGSNKLLKLLLKVKPGNLHMLAANCQLPLSIEKT